MRTSQHVKIGNEVVQLTHIDKPLWPQKHLTKANYISYLTTVAPHMLPFLKNRLLTVVRYPHGSEGDSFFQKNCPAYAPNFVETFPHDDIDYIVCNRLETFIWLGNQLAFEFHVPFQTIHSQGPSEIVFDLDPPTRDAFPLSVTAALAIKEICDRLNLITFVKTSGNKGLQIYIPLPEKQFSYADTRLFTQFVAEYLVAQKPKQFTTERLKKNRGNKLYIDYLQHAEGKTIIAPYSVRGDRDALVATPLFWEEVTASLSPEQFPLEVVEKRSKQQACPFHDFFAAKTAQPFQPVVAWLKTQNI